MTMGYELGLLSTAVTKIISDDYLDGIEGDITFNGKKYDYALSRLGDGGLALRLYELDADDETEPTWYRHRRREGRW